MNTDAAGPDLPPVAPDRSASRNVSEPAASGDLPSDAAGMAQLSPLRALLPLIPLAVIAVVGSNLLGLWSLGLAPEARRPTPSVLDQFPEPPARMQVPPIALDVPPATPEPILPDFTIPAPPAVPERPPFELAQVLERLPAADIAAGAQSFKMCAACHTVEKGGAHKIGPSLWGVYESFKGGHADFAYSTSLKAVRGTWTAAELARFLNNPRAALPGTKMAFRGIEDPVRLADLIAYLATLRDGPQR